MNRHFDITVPQMDLAGRICQHHRASYPDGLVLTEALPVDLPAQVLAAGFAAADVPLIATRVAFDFEAMRVMNGRSYLWRQYDPGRTPKVELVALAKRNNVPVGKWDTRLDIFKAVLEKLEPQIDWWSFAPRFASGAS